MLSDEEKQHLRAEEIFRQEVRLELKAAAPKQSKMGRFWSALNTPFVLWMLSSVLIGFFGWAYSTIQSSRDANARNEELVRKLDVEITNRIQETLGVIGPFVNEVVLTEREASRIIEVPALGAPDRVSGLVERAASRAIAILNNAPKADRASGIYPEYNWRTFLSLIAELQPLVSPSERKELAASTDAFRALEKMGLGGQGVLLSKVVGDNSNEANDVEQNLRFVMKTIGRVRLDRWKGPDDVQTPPTS